MYDPPHPPPLAHVCHHRRCGSSRRSTTSRRRTRSRTSPRMSPRPPATSSKKGLKNQDMELLDSLNTASFLVTQPAAAGSSSAQARKFFAQAQFRLETRGGLSLGSGLKTRRLKPIFPGSVSAQARRSRLKKLMPNKNFELRNSVFQEFFSNFTEVFICQKNGAITRAPFSSAITKEKKNVFLFLAIFDKNTDHRVTKFHPVYRINITYKFYFMFFL